MAKNDLFFVYNPKSGKARIKNKLSDILEELVKAGYEVTVRPTLKKKDATELVRRKKNKFDLVLCAGGDGTLDEVVSGMMQNEKKVPIGYIPAGSTNDFATGLGLPLEMMKAVKVAITGKNYPCDIGWMNGNYFVYVAAFGIFTEVSYETSQDMKNSLGHIAYILEGMKKLSGIRSYPMKIVWDEGEMEDDFLLGMVTNSKSVGGLKNITGKGVELDDGLFEVTLIRRPLNAGEWNQVLGALMNNSLNASVITSFKTGKVFFYSQEPVAWTRDGEYGGTHKEVEIRNEYQALQFRVP